MPPLCPHMMESPWQRDVSLGHCWASAVQAGEGLWTLLGDSLRAGERFGGSGNYLILCPDWPWLCRSGAGGGPCGPLLSVSPLESPWTVCPAAPHTTAQAFRTAHSPSRAAGFSGGPFPFPGTLCPGQAFLTSLLGINSPYIHATGIFQVLC